MEVGLISPSLELNRTAEAFGATTFLAPIGDRPGMKDLKAMALLKRFLILFGPDLLHVHGLRAAWLARPVARLMGLPVVVTYHATLDAGNRLRQAITIQLERLMSRWHGQAIAVSEGVRAELLTRVGLAPASVITINNGIDFSRLNPQHTRLEVRNSLGIPGEATIVGTVARHAPQKDLPTLLQAAVYVVARAPETHFVLVGDGPLRHELTQLSVDLGLTGHVHFLGHRPDMPDLLGIMDIFALSSRYEGAPLSVIEAMGAGLPVVTTKVAGTSELIADGVTGFLVSPGDPMAMAERILRLTADLVLRARTGNEAQRSVRELYDLERMIFNTCQVYRTIIATAEHDKKSPPSRVD